MSITIKINLYTIHYSVRTNQTLKFAVDDCMFRFRPYILLQCQATSATTTYSSSHQDGVS